MRRAEAKGGLREYWPLVLNASGREVEAGVRRNANAAPKLLTWLTRHGLVLFQMKTRDFSKIYENSRKS